MALTSIASADTTGQSPLDPMPSIVNAVAASGYAICENFLPTDAIQALLQLAQQNQREDQLALAGIGRGTDFQANRFVRQDRIRWLSAEQPIENRFLDPMEKLRVALNRSLFMGLFDYEAHLAVYTEGAFYKKHLDAFKGSTNRRLSTVLYLNPDWQPGDGGELRCYDPMDNSQRLFDLAPQAGTLLVFESERFWHEVLPARRARYSIAGWFRVNGSVGGRIDPPR